LLHGKIELVFVGILEVREMASLRRRASMKVGLAAV